MYQNETFHLNRLQIKEHKFDTYGNKGTSLEESQIENKSTKKQFVTITIQTKDVK